MNTYFLSVIIGDGLIHYEIEAENVIIRNNTYHFTNDEGVLVSSFPVERTLIDKIEYEE